MSSLSDLGETFGRRTRRLSLPADAGRHVSVHVARSVDQLEAHRRAWDGLAAASPQQLPMLSHAWLTTFFEHICPQDGWACVLVYRGSELVAVLPVVAERRRRLGRPITVLTTPRDDHTTQVGDLLAEPEAASAAAIAIDAARREFPEACYLEIKRFSDASPLLDWVRTRRLPGRYWHDVDSFGSYLPVPADYAEFRRKLGKNFRLHLNQATNRLAALPEVRFEFASGREARCEDLEMLMKVEASGWKGEQGSAIAGSPRLVEFYSALVRRLHDAGWLEWQFMYGDGEVLAGNLAIRMPRAVTLWKVGYNDKYSRYSPGSLLIEQVLKRASQENGPAIVETTTDQPWHDKWGMSRRPFYTARFYFGARGYLFGYLPDVLRSRLRQVPLAVALKNALPI